MSTAPDWRSFQQHFFHDAELDFSLDVSRVGWPASYMEEMGPAMAAATAEMAALEGGAVANADENRQVGHYWLRDPGRAPDVDLKNQIEQDLAAVTDFAAAVHAGRVRPPSAARFTRYLLIGIGGSALGPQLAHHALSSAGDRMAAQFFDNTDPEGFDAILERLKGGLAECLTLVVSKSGGTKETRNGMLEAQAAYAAAGLDFRRHAVAVTGAGSALDTLAARQEWLARFPMYDWIGGRTSQTSAVGLLPAALSGFDITDFLRGAREMDGLTRRPEVRRNPAALMALAWHHLTGGKGEKDMVILPYKDRLAPLSRYLQQLVMESLGKEKDRDGKVVHQGISVYGNKGSTDQHAYVQQLRDGVANFFTTFIEVQEERRGPLFHVEPEITSGDYLAGFLLGTRQALYEGGRCSLTVGLSQVNARSLGMIIALFERAVGLYASLVNINAYHQPGVESGKKAAAEILDVQASVVQALKACPGAWFTAAEAAAAAGMAARVEDVFHLLRRLGRDGRRGIEVEQGEDIFANRYSWRPEA